MNNILITGSRGFLGTNICRSLTVSYDEIDLTLGSDHRNIVGRNGTLIFLSSYVRPDLSMKRPAEFIENNLVGLSLLLSNNNFEKVIFPSSNAVYDAYGNLEPSSVYGVTKLAGENLVKLYCKNYWILRLGNPYGYGDTRSMFHELAKCKLENKAFPIYSLGNMRRDYFPVSFVSSIVNKILGRKILPGTYNVGSGGGTVVKDFILSVCKQHHINYGIIDLPTLGASEGYIPTFNLLKSEPTDIEKDWAVYYLR